MTDDVPLASWSLPQNQVCLQAFAFHLFVGRVWTLLCLKLYVNSLLLIVDHHQVKPLGLAVGQGDNFGDLKIFDLLGALKEGAHVLVEVSESDRGDLGELVTQDPEVVDVDLRHALCLLEL